MKFETLGTLKYTGNSKRNNDSVYLAMSYYTKSFQVITSFSLATVLILVVLAQLHQLDLTC
jgi:hypothetical protein